MLEDVASPAEVRAGAAVALKHSLDEEGKERLRVAAEACASPKLRTTFEAVRTGANDAALEEALAALSA